MKNDNGSPEVQEAIQFAGYRAAVRGENRAHNPYGSTVSPLAVLWEKGFDAAVEDLNDYRGGAAKRPWSCTPYVGDCNLENRRNKSEG